MAKVVHHELEANGVDRRVVLSAPYTGEVRGDTNLSYDHDHPGTVPSVDNGSVVHRPAYRRGDPVGQTVHQLSGQHYFTVDRSVTALHFDDGTVADLTGEDA